MRSLKSAQTPFIKPGRIGFVGVYLAYAAVFVRTLAIDGLRIYLPAYLGLELAYLGFFTLIFSRNRMPTALVHLYFAIQSTLVLMMVSIYPNFDFIVVLFLLLSFQVALFLKGRSCWIWIGILITLTGGSLIIYLGVLKGLALSLTTIAAEIVLPAYVRANQDIQAAQTESQSILAELQETHQRLETYTAQVEELATVQERNRLARGLHDTVSQLIFSISLTIRSTQLLLEKEPERVPQQLENLSELTSQALSQLRSLITKLRPPQNSKLL